MLLSKTLGKKIFRPKKFRIKHILDKNISRKKYFEKLKIALNRAHYKYSGLYDLLKVVGPSGL